MNNRRILALFLVAFLVSVALVNGQTSRGTVTGLVTDPSGAAIPSAEVEITNQLTNVKRTTQSNAAGLYRFDAVDPGEYTVTVRSTGFTTSVTRNIPVQAGQTAAVDLRLEVGRTETVVEVAAQAEAVLQTEAPVRGGNISTMEAQELPVAGRDPTQIALALPGVSSNRFGFGVGTFPVNGSRGRSNNFLIDGVDNNDTGVAGQAMRIRNPDAVQEVSVQTSNFDAEYGRAGGAVVNTITKSGTNDFHGSLFYILDSTYDDALTITQSRDPVQVKRGRPLPGTEQWYGLTLGGPVIRNRTFFFGGWHDQRQNSQNTTSATIPSAAGFATLNQLFPQGRNPRVDLYRQVVGDARATSGIFPVALGDGRPDVEFGDAIWSYPNKYLDRQWLAKVDHQISNSDQISGRFVNQDITGVGTTHFSGFDTSYVNQVKNAIVNHTHVFSPSLTNELRVSYARIELGYPLDPANELGVTLPRYTIAGVSAIGIQTNMPQGRIANNYTLQDTMNWVRGTHSFRFGVDLVNQRSRDLAPIRERGEITYAVAGSYTGFANFVDDYSGTNGGTWKDFGNAANYPRTFRQAYFFQDRWRATQSLTLTLGIRYDYFGVPMNALTYPAYGGLFNVDPVTLNGPYRQPSKVEADKNNWAPLIGIAWSPSYTNGVLGKLFGDRRSVVRTGYQVSYDMFFNNILSNAATSTPNVIATQVQFPSNAANPRGQAGVSQLLPATAREPLPVDTQALVPRNLRTPYMQKWSFGVQRELPANFIVDLSYVGSKGTKLFASEDLNPLVPSGWRAPFPSNTDPRVRNSGRLDPMQGYRLIRTNGGSSNYHSFQALANRRFANGFMSQVAYTWSKMIDNTSEIFGATQGSPQNTQLPSLYGGLHFDRGLSLFDRTHRLVISYIYEFPWMREQRGFFGRVLGGWQLSGLTTFETGAPQNVANGADSDGIGSNFDRPDINPAGRAGVRAVPDSTSPTGYVNPDAIGSDGKFYRAPINPSEARYIGNRAFTGTPTPGKTGNAGRHTERTPGLNNWDATLQKSVRITERFETQLRVEAYNVFNHPQYLQGSVSPFSPGGGTMANGVLTAGPGRFLNPQWGDGGGRVLRYQLRVTF